jgi:hypothetical protein
LFVRSIASRSFALLAAIALLVVQAGPAAAYVLRSDEGRFSIELPAEPSFQAIDEQSAAGAHVRYQWLVDLGHRAFIVTYNDYARTSEAETIYDNGLEGALTATKGSLVRQQAVTLEGLQGREFFARMPSGNTLRQRLFLVGNRFYQNIYVGPPGSEVEPAVEAFLASFRVVR